VALVNYYIPDMVRLPAVNGNDRLVVSVTNTMYVCITLNLVHCCDSLDELDGVSFEPVSSG